MSILLKNLAAIALRCDRLLIVTVAGLCWLGSGIQFAQAEGSRDLYPASAPGHRGAMLWRGDSSGGFKDRTLLRVFAQQNEYILMGSSAVDVGSGNILVYRTATGSVANENLSNLVFDCKVNRTVTGQGKITTRNQELAGSRSVNGAGNTGGYVPCVYQAPATGVYYIAMYGPSGDNSTASPNAGANSATIANPNFTTTQATGISVWDVTVRNSNTSSITDIKGRLYSFYISMNMGNNQKYLHSNIYPVTVDGYRYEVDMRGLDPFGFKLYGNQVGNWDSDGKTPLYHDLLGTDGSITNPEGGASAAPPQFPIFFNPPDSNALSYVTRYDTNGTAVGTSIPTAPIPPEVTNPNFTGKIANNTSGVNEGGTFTFNSNVIGTYQITISQDGSDFDPSNPQNRVLRGIIATTGSQSVGWNGLDNTGTVFPVGDYPYKIQVNSGEYHFPMSDVENNLGGPTIRLLNASNPLGNTTAFYDDRSYTTLNGTLVGSRDPDTGEYLPLCGQQPPNPAFSDPIFGTDSSAPNFRKFGVLTGGNTNTKCTGAFGDTKTLDMWIYFPSEPKQNALKIIDPNSNNPSVLLVKRITAINGQAISDGGDDLSKFNNDSGTIDDDAPNWPDNDDIYLRGGIDGGKVKPGDEIEYTIYFLSSGVQDARDVTFCDVIPIYTRFVENTYSNGFGIALASDANQLPSAPTKVLTNGSEDDEGQFHAPGSLPPAVCKDPTNLVNSLSAANNTTGSVVVKLGNLPRASSSGSPTNSYGFFRFRTKVL